jgi:hypothetical protein
MERELALEPDRASLASSANWVTWNKLLNVSELRKYTYVTES